MMHDINLLIAGAMAGMAIIASAFDRDRWTIVVLLASLGLNLMAAAL